MIAVPLRERLEEVRSRGSVIAIGNFDGIHAGHRALLARARDLAANQRASWVVVSFFPPAKALFTGVPFLASREEKYALLAELAPTEIVIVPFDHTFAETPAEAFVASVAALRPWALVVGEDFRFGRGRAGAAEDLGPAASRVEVLRLVAIDGEVVKSSAIRSALEAGEIERANRLLGAPYRVRGRVAVGDRRGRTIGVPTANVEVPPGKALPQGVFAVQVDVPLDRRYGGMANVGARPSFDTPAPALEVHLFGFDGDLYGRELTVHLIAKLRDQARFEGLEALKAQLGRDADAARALLAAAAEPEGGEQAIPADAGGTGEPC